MMTEKERNQWESAHGCEVCGEPYCNSCDYDDQPGDQENE
jgi:hypothetical protein